MKLKALGAVALLAVGFVVFLLAAPARIDPVEWEPPPVPKAEGPYAPNERLKPAVPLAPELKQPEALAFDPAGNLVAGLADGRVVRMTTDGKNVTELVNTGGRPLGLKYAPDGRLFICDAHKGLLALGADGKLEDVVPAGGEQNVRVADDLAISKAGVVYFSDASARHPLERYVDDVFEHRGSGRVLRWDPATKKVDVLAIALSFANGVALSPNEDYLLVNETGSNRIVRVWLQGPKSGQRETFLDALPGFPDNVTWSPERHVFWVAIFGPRDPLVDGLAGHPTLRRMFSHLPTPPLAHLGYALAVDENGKPVESLQWDSPDAYYPVTSVLERDGWLYLGSIVHAGFAKVKL